MSIYFRLMMPSRHLRLGSKTPDPEFPVVATSLIHVENFLRDARRHKMRPHDVGPRYLAGGVSNNDRIPWPRWRAHIAAFGILSKRAGSLCTSTDNKLKSTSSEPCFKTLASKGVPNKPTTRTLILASTAVRCAAVMIRPDPR